MYSQILHFIKSITRHKGFLLISVIAYAALFHWYYINKLTATMPSLIDILGWVCAIFLIWKKGNQIKFRTNFLNIAIGFLLIGWMLTRHVLSQSNNSLDNSMDALSFFYPIIIFTGILLSSVGISQFKKYKSELSIMAVISLPAQALSTTILSPIIRIDAKLLAFSLHYIGFEVSRKEYTISLPKGAVEVLGGCSSIIPIITMTALLVMLTNIYKTNLRQQIFIYLAATISIILINNIRLCTLAILVNANNLQQFNYWHHGGGETIFSNIIVVFVGGLTYLWLEKHQSIRQSEELL
ncbi:MAG: archaeosortase/exosortase family protein [Pseudanabaenaceae cyanobacterium bins.39]|nr:archaeosortase/exosortase family protein [Pseudanabaenaceae cyanobacterium bins.39]